MKGRFDISIFNARLATTIMALAGLGIAVIILVNMQWLVARFHGFYEFATITVIFVLLVLPVLFVGWVFAWIIGRRKKDVEHTRLPIGKGIATIVLFFAFLLALSFTPSETTNAIVLDPDDVTMQVGGGRYSIEFYGSGVVSEDQYISMEVTKEQFDKILDFDGDFVLVYTYYSNLPDFYQFELAKSHRDV